MLRWKANRQVEFKPADLPEFDLSVSWFMCRNPMCPNFGVFFEGQIPKGGTSSSDDRYKVKIKPVTYTTTHPKTEKKQIDRKLVGEIECRSCGHNARLHSNRSIRAIARYYLSLSLPYADCANPECPNHGVNVFEHWADVGTELANGGKRPYRLTGSEHQVCCRRCGTAKNLARRRKNRVPGSHEPFSPYINLGEVMSTHGVNRRTRALWGNIIDGVRTRRTVTDSYEILPNLTISTYYRHLKCIALRLRDYHSARNARLLHPDFIKRKEPIKLFTDVLDVSLQAWERKRRHVLLKYIVTAVPAGDTIFILAAHPFFLPTPLCPDDKARDRDDPMFRLDFERDWDCVLHEGIVREPGATTARSLDEYPEVGRGGYFIRSPYAEVAHFLTVQKMLCRFQTIHCYMDSAKELYTAALVAMRERVLAGRPGANRPEDGRRRDLPAVEMVLFQHKKKERVLGKSLRPEQYEDLTIKERREKRKKALRIAWKAAEKRIRVKARDRDVLPNAKRQWESLTMGERARVLRRAFTGGYSKYGGWAWLRYPSDSPMYRRPRTLWLTRMPGKTFREHGEPILFGAWLQPVDSAMNAIRARVHAAHRPATRAIGRGFSERYVLPEIVHHEMLIYLIGRNYSLRRKTRQKFIPAAKLGLMKLDLKAEVLDRMVREDVTAAVALLKSKPGASKRLMQLEIKPAVALMREDPEKAIEELRKAPDQPRLDYLKQAWDFRLGVSHAKRISRWLRT